MTKKELKKMNYEELENYVLDMADELWGKGYASLSFTRIDKNWWSLEMAQENFVTEDSTKELCLLDFYDFILDEILKDQVDNEKLAEEETRLSYDRWFNNNCGVAYGKY